MGNPYFLPEGSGGGAWRYFVILAAVVSTLIRERRADTGQASKLMVSTAVFALFILLHSIFFSPQLDVSVLKLMSWAAVVLVLLSAWGGMSAERRQKTFAALEQSLAALMLFSLPLLALPEAGYRVNGQGFQGVLNHPQAFGPIAALACVISATKILGNSNFQWSSVLFFILSLMLVFLSEARTAGLAMVLGIVAAVGVFSIVGKGALAKQFSGLGNGKGYILLAGGGLVLILTGPLIASKAADFVLKRGDSTSFLDAADASRGALVQKMLTNIQTNPWAGIGFGIASDVESMEVIRDPVFNLPVSAIVEKGVMPIAVLEELGVFGALTAFFWLAIMLMAAVKNGVPAVALFLTIVFLNLGEATFFSVGGTGLVLLVFFTSTLFQCRKV
ncbi:hypothetical protein [Variovorax sp. LT1R16]|uniref:hypothetical protein n=1 Tax=Variovorax sp. LT1R16 TaxID=3443728 RepID=UPI003F471546